MEYLMINLAETRKGALNLGAWLVGRTISIIEGDYKWRNELPWANAKSY